MRMYDIILKKRRGEELSDAEIRFFINGYTLGDIPDYQASALMMAICFNGMTESETATMTDAMSKSGDTVDLSCFGDLSVDKHSTGGVGDKTSLIVAPIVAALGAKVSKMSGRGLGHTGGTVDKLESIPGYRVSLSPEEFISQVERIGVAVIGQSGNLTPADKKLYALRDVTATVDSIPLIVSSIMSKKLAAGSRSIVLDVKVGSGAFMKTFAQAEKLATEMVKIGKVCGRNMAAVLTDMDKPLGRAIGNSLEIKEAIAVLKGETGGELREVCVTLAANMVSLVFVLPIDQARVQVEDVLDSGKALCKMKEWISAQGGDTAYIDNPLLFGESNFSLDVLSRKSGYIMSMDAAAIGGVSVTLGAGRVSKEDEIDYGAGIVLAKTVGDYVEVGEPLCRLFTGREESLLRAEADFLGAVMFSEQPPAEKPLVYKVIR